jgi:hypothetical protein
MGASEILGSRLRTPVGSQKAPRLLGLGFSLYGGPSNRRRQWQGKRHLAALRRIHGRGNSDAEAGRPRSSGMRSGFNSDGDSAGFSGAQGNSYAPAY